jgi:hypothetical protein
MNFSTNIPEIEFLHPDAGFLLHVLIKLEYKSGPFFTDKCYTITGICYIIHTFTPPCPDCTALKKKI